MATDSTNTIASTLNSESIQNSLQYQDGKVALDIKLSMQSDGIARHEIDVINNIDQENDGCIPSEDILSTTLPPDLKSGLTNPAQTFDTEVILINLLSKSHWKRANIISFQESIGSDKTDSSSDCENDLQDMNDHQIVKSTADLVNDVQRKGFAQKAATFSYSTKKATSLSPNIHVTTTFPRRGSVMTVLPSDLQPHSSDEDETQSIHRSMFYKGTYKLRYKENTIREKNRPSSTSNIQRINVATDDESLQQLNNHDSSPEDDQSKNPAKQDTNIHQNSRVHRAAKVGLELLQYQNVNMKDPGKSRCTCCTKLMPSLNTPPSLLNAQRAGFKMMPKFFFPALPKFLEDIWVTLELIVVIFDFIFNWVTFNGSRLSLFIVILTTVAILLTLIDVVLYFISSEGSCFRHKCLKYTSKCNCFQFAFIPKSWKDKLNVSFEVIRTILSELLLFPLALADIIELVISRTFATKDTENRIDFSLFIIGLFYLILTVYFVRIFMSIVSIINLKRIKKTTSNNYHLLAIKFFVHLLLQVLVNATILVMLSVKLKIDTCEGSEELNPNLPLWYQMIFGNFISFLGILAFFLINYPALKQFSISFFIDIMSSVVSENFGDMVFQGDGFKMAKAKAEQVTKKVNISNLVTEFEKFKKQFSIKQKILYRLTNPIVTIGATIYSISIIAFFICHTIGYVDPCNSESGLEFILIREPSVITTFVIGVLLTLVANYQALIIFLMVLAIVTFIASIPILAVLLTPFILFISVIYFCISFAVHKQKTINGPESEF